MSPYQTIRLCFTLVMLVGIGCLVVGPALDSLYPYQKLEVVLSPEELADRQVHDQTLAILKKGSRQDWPFWVLLGASLIGIGLVGLRAAYADTGPATCNNKGAVR